MPPLRSRFWWATGVSLLIAAALSVPLAVYVNAHLQRLQIVRQLDAADDTTREKALNALVLRGPEDPKLVEQVIEAIPTFDAETIVQTYNALNAAGLSRDQRVVDAIVQAMQPMGHDDFSRVCQLLEAHGQSSDPGVVQQAINRIGEVRRDRDRFAELYVLLDNAGAWNQPTIPSRIWVRWVRYGMETDDDVARATALSRLAALSDLLDSRSIYRVISTASEDESPLVRLTFLKVIAAHAVQQPYFRECINEALDDPDPGVSGLAHRLVELIDQEPTSTTPTRFVGTPLEAVAAEDRVACWREVLDVPVDEQTRPWLASLAATPHPDQDLLPIVLAATYRLGEPPRIEASDPSDDDWMRTLAALEGCGPGSADLQPPDDLPHLLRPALFRIASEPDPAWLLPTFRLDGRSAVRDQACLVAAARLSTEQLDALIATLLEDYDPEGRMSAALLAGLTGRQSQLLHKALSAEKRFAVQRLLMVGLWMQGLMPELDATVPGMLGRSDLPQSTLLLAMLDSRLYRDAIDHLLGGPATTGMSDAALVELLGRQRFGKVVQVYLPDDAPPLELWADGERFLDNLTQLRTWNLLHRLD